MKGKEIQESRKRENRDGWRLLCISRPISLKSTSELIWFLQLIVHSLPRYWNSSVSHNNFPFNLTCILLPPFPTGQNVKFYSSIFGNNVLMCFLIFLSNSKLIFKFYHINFNSLHISIANGIWKLDPGANIWAQEGWEWGVEKASQWGTW